MYPLTSFFPFLSPASFLAPTQSSQPVLPIIVDFSSVFRLGRVRLFPSITIPTPGASSDLWYPVHIHLCVRQKLLIVGRRLWSGGHSALAFHCPVDPLSVRCHFFTEFRLLPTLVSACRLSAIPIPFFSVFLLRFLKGVEGAGPTIPIYRSYQSLRSFTTLWFGAWRIYLTGPPLAWVLPVHNMVQCSFAF